MIQNSDHQILAQMTSENFDNFDKKDENSRVCNHN